MKAWDASGCAITTPVADRVVWVSGRSSAAHAALSPAQQSLIGLAEPYGFVPVAVGFPFRDPEAPWRHAGIVGASARNATQYLALRREETVRQVAARLAPLLALTTDRLLVVCGSLGLDLLLRGLRAGEPPAGRVRVVALGPVCTVSTGGLDLRVAQAPGDVLSRAVYRGPVTVRPPCGHLGYATHPQVRSLVVAAAAEAW